LAAHSCGTAVELHHTSPTKPSNARSGARDSTPEGLVRGFQSYHGSRSVSIKSCPKSKEIVYTPLGGSGEKKSIQRLLPVGRQLLMDAQFHSDNFDSVTVLPTGPAKSPAQSSNRETPDSRWVAASNPRTTPALLDMLARTGIP